MKFKDVYIGQKVVPHDKTNLSALESFSDWLKEPEGKFFKANGYIFVSKVKGCDVLLNLFGLNSGYTFNASDFEPYTEQTKAYQKQKFGGYIQGNKTVVYIGDKKGESNYNPNDAKQGLPYSAPYDLLLAYCRATDTDAGIVDRLFKKAESKSIEPQKPAFVPHLEAVWRSGVNDLGKIGTPTNRTDTINQPLFVGDTVETYDKSGKKCDFFNENFVCYENGKFEVMGCYGQLENPTSTWRFLKKRSFSDVKNGEIIAQVKYVKEDKP